MAQKESVWSGKLKHKGYWNFKDTYTMMYDWLKDWNYSVSEDLYKEVDDGGKEIIINWTAEKKVTDYFKYEISIEWHILGMIDAEVEIEGKKKKMNKGELGLSIKATIIKDYDKRWEDKPFHKFLRGLYENYIIKTAIKQYKDTLEDEVGELVSDTKAYLRLSS